MRHGALVDLDNFAVQHFRLADLKIEKTGSGLVANVDQVPETFGDEQGMFLSFALQEGIGSDRLASTKRVRSSEECLQDCSCERRLYLLTVPM